MDTGLTQRDLGKTLKKPHAYVHKSGTGDPRKIEAIIRWRRACGRWPGKSLDELAESLPKERDTVLLRAQSASSSENRTSPFSMIIAPERFSPGSA